MQLGFVAHRTISLSSVMRSNCHLLRLNHPSANFCAVSFSKSRHDSFDTDILLSKSRGHTQGQNGFLLEDFSSFSKRNNSLLLTNSTAVSHGAAFCTALIPGFCQLRMLSTQPHPQKSGSITEVKKTKDSEVTIGQKVVQAGKDVTYTSIFLIGVAVTGVMFFAIGRELLSGQSPTGIYRKAFAKCKKNDDVYVLLGSPLKAYGETNRRGRRRFTNHTEFVRDDVRYMRMKFYIEGPSQKATVHLEAKQDEHQKYQFRYIFVEPENGLRGPIIIEDNR